MLTLLLIATAAVPQAQTFAELFKQKKTQQKYLVQQIAALKVYAGCLQKGYSIAREGWQMIGALKKGELDLHRAFFYSLESVNPGIKSYARVADIIQLQAMVLRDCNRVAKQLAQHDLFNPEERGYLYRVFDKLFADGLATVSALMRVITPGKLTMKDAERLERIDRLYEDMQEQYVFSKKFIHEIKWMVAYRQQEKREVLTVHAVYGIKKGEP